MVKVEYEYIGGNSFQIKGTDIVVDTNDLWKALHDQNFKSIQELEKMKSDLEKKYPDTEKEMHA